MYIYGLPRAIEAALQKHAPHVQPATAHRFFSGLSVLFWAYTARASLPLCTFWMGGRKCALEGSLPPRARDVFEDCEERICIYAADSTVSGALRSRCQYTITHKSFEYLAECDPILRSSC